LITSAFSAVHVRYTELLQILLPTVPYCQCQACQDLALYIDALPVEVSDFPACDLLSLEHPAASCHSAYDSFPLLYIRVSAITSSLPVVVCSLCDKYTRTSHATLNTIIHEPLTAEPALTIPRVTIYSYSNSPKPATKIHGRQCVLSPAGSCSAQSPWPTAKTPYSPASTQVFPHSGQDALARGPQHACS
jgi:hypothetical protein